MIKSQGIDRPILIVQSEEEDHIGEIPGMGLKKDLKYFFVRNLFPSAIFHLLRLYVRTLRVRVENTEEFERHLEAGGRLIFCAWHQRLFVSFCYSRFHRLALSLMISQSRDGDVIADIAQRFGGVPVRGSSSRGGERALREMISAMSEKRAGAHIVDGPRGPARVVKPGLILLAQKAEAAICPVYVSFDRSWTFNSWDRFMVPKPFSRVYVRMGALDSVPWEADANEFERIRREIEQRMIEGYEEADRYWEQRSR
jgi:hypothetical protein